MTNLTLNVTKIWQYIKKSLARYSLLSLNKVVWEHRGEGEKKSSLKRNAEMFLWDFNDKIIEEHGRTCADKDEKKNISIIKILALINNPIVSDWQGMKLGDTYSTHNWQTAREKKTPILDSKLSILPLPTTFEIKKTHKCSLQQENFKKKDTSNLIRDHEDGY